MRRAIAEQVAAELRREFEGAIAVALAAQDRRHQEKLDIAFGAIEDLAGRCFDLEVTNVELHQKLGLNAPRPTTGPEWVRVKRAAGMLDVTVTRVGQLVKAGRLARREGRPVMISLESLQNFKLLKEAHRR